MASDVVYYFYVLTVQLTNPAGGTSRIISDAEAFLDNADLTEEQKLGQSLKALSSREGIWLLKGHSNRPDFSKFSILFYQCTHDAGPIGSLGADLVMRELGHGNDI